MPQRSALAHVLHDAGLAIWFGGSLTRAASGGALTPAEGAGVGAHLLGTAMLGRPSLVKAAVTASAGQDASWQTFGVVEDQEGTLRDDVRKIRSHPLIPDTIAVGGFMYDVDTGLLAQRI